jgi:hypothetical protein
MTSAAMTMDNVDALTFAKSESKPVGMHGSLMDKLRDNAPRIVGALKLVADVTIGFVASPLMIAYSVFAVTGRLIMMAYGTKAHQEELAAEKAAGKIQPLENSFSGSLKKMTRPSHYPMEAAAGFSVIGETSALGYGVERFAAGASGFTSILLGVVAILTYANILFTKEKKKDSALAEESESLVFEKSQSKPVGIIGRIRMAMKNNPVLVSSLIGVGISIGMLVGGIAEAYGAAWLAASVMYIAANTLQAILVRKNDFNIDGAGQDKSQQNLSHQDRLVAQRARGDDLGLQPT